MLKDKVKNILVTLTGEKRMTARDITECCDLCVSHDTAPNVRKAIRQLIKDGMPIGSDQFGYFVITERNQLEDVLEDLQSRCDAIQDRITDITKAYNKVRDNRHVDSLLPMKDRCRFYVIYMAEEAGIPYQAVWSMAYRKLQKLTGVDLVNLPSWYQGSVLNYICNQGIENELYAVLSGLERVVIC